INFYAPLLRRNRIEDRPWLDRLAQDYEVPEHHIEFRRAVGRRLRRNYMWIFTVQTFALFGKCIGTAHSGATFDPLRIGPFPGSVLASIAAAGYIALAFFTYAIWRLDKRRFKERQNPISMG
ncbi:MAG: DUF2270 domain-containing protein, partial [Parvularcula sp.]|nr:DUF2270 domain-containing protein [Parvularcula sp.]